jgi:hypothetical protein
VSRALLLAVALAAAPALAVPVCGDTSDTCQCGANNPYPCCDNGGNCTWYAWHSACCNWGVGLPGWGNANTWAQYASANGNYRVLSSPVVNAVSCRAAGTYGHVAFVTSLNAGGSITVREQNCWGNYGVKVSNYAPSFFTGGFIVRASQVQCSPGDSQTQSCGNCGTQTRGCSSAGTWDGWGACTDQGACAPGAEETQACGDCGVAKRSCSSSCQWNGFGACESAPSFEPQACATGAMGACGTGAQACVSGVLECRQTVTASSETCDGVDNDCNGLVDDGACKSTLAPPPAPPAPPVKSIESVRGGCSAVPMVELSALAAWMLVRARRRRPTASPGSARACPRR